jgi:hypothetical protein
MADSNGNTGEFPLNHLRDVRTSSDLEINCLTVAPRRRAAWCRPGQVPDGEDLQNRRRITRPKLVGKQDIMIR